MSLLPSAFLRRCPKGRTRLPKDLLSHLFHYKALFHSSAGMPLEGKINTEFSSCRHPHLLSNFSLDPLSLWWPKGHSFLPHLCTKRKTANTSALPYQLTALYLPGSLQSLSSWCISSLFFHKLKMDVGQCQSQLIFNKQIDVWGKRLLIFFCSVSSNAKRWNSQLTSCQK